MAEPTLAGDLIDPARVAKYRALEDDLIAKIETSGKLPQWALDRMHATVAELRELPDGVAYAASHYLRRVDKIGVRAFEAVQPSMMAPATDRLACACGRSVPVTLDEKLPGRPRSRSGTCPGCGHVVAAFD